MGIRNLGVFAIVTLFILAGCGGGGGSNSSSTGGSSSSRGGSQAGPDLTLDFGVKQLQFNWTRDPEASFYKLFQNPDGASGFSQVGDDISGESITANVGIAVHFHDWGNSRFMLDACSDDGCTSSDEITTTTDDSIHAIGYLKAPNIVASHWFGYALGISADGSIFAVGAPHESSNSTGFDGEYNDELPGSGAVYVYNNEDGEWSEAPLFIKAPNADEDDGFGGALALSADGNVLAVGASSEQSGNNDPEDNNVVGAGAVYIYRRTAGAWAYEKYLKADTPDVLDNFGGAIALSDDGDVLAVGAYGAEAVYVYRHDGDNWQSEGPVTASNIDSRDRFGVSVALSGSGDLLAVGAQYESSGNGEPDDNSSVGAGAAYVYTYEESSWGETAYIKASSIESYAYFGKSVALDAGGEALAVGTFNEGNSGDGKEDGTGATYIYTRDGGTWSSTPLRLTAPHAEPQDQFGYTVSLSADGNTLVVGAIGENSDVKGVGGDQTAPSPAPEGIESMIGAVYVYRRTADGWVDSPVYVKATNTPTTFGFAVDLTADGTTMVVGAPFEASDSASVEGSQNNFDAGSSGAVYFY